MVAAHDFHVEESKNIPSDRAIRSALARADAEYDVGLVKRFNAGDETAFTEIVVRYRLRLTAI
ncbi:MAG: hypothetical protein ABI273_00410, partial [Lacunisphaera sp.]